MIPFFQVTKTESCIFGSPADIQGHKQYGINQDIQLRNPSVVVQSTPFGDKSVLRVEFLYAITYINPAIGNIRFEGICDYFGDVDLNGIVQEWDSGHANPAVRNEIANHMIVSLVPIALLLSRALGLPPSIPIPQIDFTAQKVGEGLIKFSMNLMKFGIGW